MKITTLIENRSSESDPHLAAEWGLSIHINFNDHNILFDTGASGSFAKNAEHLSIDLAAVDTAVLSHHHFDHGDGLRRFFEVNKNARVHLGEPPGGECFTRFLFFIKKYVGLDQSALADFPERFRTISTSTEIFPNVFVFPHISGPYAKPASNKHLYVRKDGKFVPDGFSHEIVAAIRDNGKLVIFTGCSHNGILNMVDTVAREFRGVPIKAVIGGFHLVSVPPFNTMVDHKSMVAEIGRMMLDYPVEKTFTGHCTSPQAFAILKGVMGEQLVDIRTGTQFEI